MRDCSKVVSAPWFGLMEMAPKIGKLLLRGSWLGCFCVFALRRAEHERAAAF